MIGVDPSRQGDGLGRALTIAGLESLAGRGITVGMLYVDADNEAAVGLYRVARLRHAPHRPRLRPRRRTVRRDRQRSHHSVRRDARRRRRAARRVGRAALPRRPGVGGALPPTACRSTTPPRCRARCATRLADALAARARTRSPSRPRDDGMTTQVAVACARDGAQIETVLMRYPDARHRVRVVAGRLRDGLHVLRDRPGRVRAPPRRRRDRRAGAARRATRRRSASATSSSWAWASRSPTSTRRGPRSSACTTTSGISARRITVSTVGVVPGMRRLAHEDLPVTLAVSLHAATDDARERARPAQPPLPDRRGARRRRRVRRRQGPPGHVRVRVHRRRERLARAGRGARPAAGRVPGPAAPT